MIDVSTIFMPGIVLDSLHIDNENTEMQQANPSVNSIPDVRTKAITKAVLFGLVGNAILAAAKLAVGLLSGSLAVVADGIDSASDVVISLVSLVAVRIMSKPSDAEHPFGHGRAETIATTILAFVVFFAGAQLAFGTISDLIVGTVKEMPASFALWVTIASIGGKLLLAWNQFHVGRKNDSAMLIANGANMRNDIITSCTVLLGLGATFLLNLPILDSVFALIVSALIIKTAIGIFLEVNNELMDGNTDTQLYRDLFDAVRAVPGANNAHRARIRRIANTLAIDLDIEVDGALSVADGHQIAMNVEKSVKARMSDVYDVMVHVEPLGSHESGECFGLREGSVDETKAER